MQTIHLSAIFRGHRLTSAEILAKAAERAEVGGDLVAAFKLRQMAQQAATEASRVH